jgi:hypothetical protein
LKSTEAFKSEKTRISHLTWVAVMFNGNLFAALPN